MTVPLLKRILYVEDDADIRHVAVMAMELVGGLEVRAFESGTAAGKVVDFSADLLLIDVMMPDMDGPSTLAHLHGQPAFTEVPAIFFTAKVRPTEIERLLKFGAIDVIGKPFDPMKLSEEIGRIWAQHHAD